MSAEGEPAGRAPLIEVRLHALSPVGPLLSAAVFAALLIAGYAALAEAFDQPIMVTRADGGLAVSSAAWAAFVMTLVFAAAVTLPAIGRSQWAASVADLALTLDEAGAARAAAMAVGPPTTRAWGAAAWFAAGAFGGFGFNLWVITVNDVAPADYLRSVGLWFFIVSPVLFGLGARAAKQLRDDDRDIAALVRDHLTVDLARLERMQVYGGLALRSALAWLVMAAIVLLFFVYATPIWVSVGALALSLAAGVYAFTTTVTPVARAVASARDAALARVRAQILAAGAQLERGEQPDAPLGELTAYESWLVQRPVWPISAPVTRRFALYGLIPVLAWFGAAAAELLLAQIT